MKPNRIIAVTILLLLSMAGCVETDEECRIRKLRYEQRNADALSIPGERLGVLPDGREVLRWQVPAEGHFIYVVGEDATTTLNRPERIGKVTHRRVEVTIGGVRYVPADAKLEQETP